jgi:tRNA threonylcarbamoyladenosine biosynthesis protein TsaE
MEIITSSINETINFGKNLAAKLAGGDVVLLYGELGAGKTTLVKGLAAGIGVKSEITSPTFSLMNVYPAGEVNLVHIDTYRLKNEQELIDIGVEDYLSRPDSVCVIEWPEKISGLLQNKKTTAITIEHIEQNRRKIITA